MIYALYFKKDEFSIKIKDGSKFHGVIKQSGVPQYYNANYYICDERKPLKELGQKIKNNWYAKALEDLSNIEKIKI